MYLIDPWRLVVNDRFMVPFGVDDSPQGNVSIINIFCYT